MKIVFTGGGTAGHVHPAIAVAERIKRENSNSDILFIGRKGGKENNIIKSSGFNLEEIDISGLKRSLSFKNLSVIKKMLTARKKAKIILSEFKPDVVFGTGGYVCLPVLLAAKSLGIKTVIHESNAYPGLSTKLLAKRSDLVLLGFPDALNDISKKANVKTVGNPIRSDFYRLTRDIARKKLGISQKEKLIVSFGGSLGAGIINGVLTEYMNYCLEEGVTVRHLHATGKAEYPYYKEKYPSLTNEKNEIRIVDYIENTPLYLHAADLAITRSGAITLAELEYTGTSAILIPSPNVAANHQYKNAIAMKKNHNCAVLEEKDLSIQTLKKAVKDVLMRKENGNKRSKTKEKCNLSSDYVIYREISALVDKL